MFGRLLTLVELEQEEDELVAISFAGLYDLERGETCPGITFGGG